jgi:hypothetical protein
MKLVKVDFDEEENPATYTVSMGLDEMAVLYRLAGHIAPKAISDLSGDVRWGNALYDLAEGASVCLNRFYDDGANDVIPKFHPFQTPPPAARGDR